MKKKGLSVVLSVFLILTSFMPLTFAVEAQSPEAFGNLDIVETTNSPSATVAALSDGQIWAGKEVTYKGDGTFDITLKAAGQNYAVETVLPQEQYDVVLVLDRSSSMRGGGLTSAQTAARSAVEQLLTVEGNRVAIVSYAGGVQRNSGLTSSRRQLDSAINSLRADGGTNIQAAFVEAQSILGNRSGSDAERKSLVVLMSDGEPTYYIDASGVRRGDGTLQGEVFSRTAAWHTIEQANVLKNSISGLQIFTIGFGVDSASGKATLMPTAANTAEMRVESVVQKQTYTEKGAFQVRRYKEWELFGGWSDWSEWAPTGAARNTVASDHSNWSDADRYPSDLRTEYTAPLLKGSIVDIDKYSGWGVKYETGYQSGERQATAYKVVDREIPFAHQYWSEGSSLTSGNTDALIKAFTDIVKKATDAKPNKIDEVDSYSDVVVTDVLGTGFELVDAPQGVTYDATTGTVKWTIEGEAFESHASGTAAVDAALVQSVTFGVKLKADVTAGTYNTNQSASVAFEVAKDNPTYTTTPVTVPVSGNGTIVLNAAQGTIVEKHVFTDDSQTVAPQTHTGNVGESRTFEPMDVAHYTYTVSQPETNGTSALTYTRAPQTIVYTYAPMTHTLTTAVEGEGSVTGAGTYAEGTEATVTATPAEGWTFVGWEGAVSGTETSATVTMDADKAVTAVFEEKAVQYTLTTGTTGEGSVTEGGTYEAGTEVTVTATPAEGWTFVGWEGAVSGTETSATVTMDADKSVTAIFEEIVVEPTEYTLTTGTKGQGSVSGGGTYTEGTEVTVTATPAEGWTFVGWEGAVSGTETSATVTMNANKSVTAVFEETQTTPDPDPVTEYTLSTGVTGQGSVSGGGTYTEGTEVTVTATPASGWTFVGWEGAVSGTEASATVTMDANKSVTAIFEEIVVEPTEYTLTTGTKGQGSVSGGGTYTEGTEVTVTATPAEGWTFVGWEGDASGGSSATVTMDADKSVTAVFEETQTTPDPDPVTEYTLSTGVTGQGSVSGGGTYTDGTEVTVTATPADGWTFVGWEGDASGGSSTTVTMNADKSVTAVFEETQTTPDPDPVTEYTLSTGVTGQGSVSGGGTYTEGTEVTVTATPAEGWTFVGWEGDASGGSSTTVTMDSDKSVTAVFEETQTTPDPDPNPDPDPTPDPDPEPVDPTPVDPTPTPEPEPEPVPAGPQGFVEVSYIDQDGSELASAFTFSGEIGTNYGTSARSFSGYELVESPSNASGTFADGTISVTYRYSDGSDEVELEVEETPLGPAIDTTEETPETTEPVVEETETTEETETPVEVPEGEIVLIDETTPEGPAALPKTGQLPISLYFGIGSILSAAGVYLRRK
ncbi:InlB B-repeat-containing protein [Fusibacter sp. JL298sf-3]